MPITLDMKGITDLENKLKRMGEGARGIAAHGLYDGVGVMADELKNQAEGIQTEDFHYTVFGTRLPSPEEKEIVTKAGAGIARFKTNGSEVNTSVGYRNAGYDMLAGRRKPIPKIVNAINSGTRFMKKQPFVRKAATKGATKAESAIIKSIEERFDEIMKK
ncbi:MAG: hypothetical protein J6U26_00270 [Lachnospiraceae bacterium]|nr:hypothetical protein [Lachnospiraceae bacterium]